MALRSHTHACEHAQILYAQLSAHAPHTPLLLVPGAPLLSLSLSILLMPPLINVPFLLLLSISVTLAFSSSCCTYVCRKIYSISQAHRDKVFFMLCWRIASSRKWLARRTNWCRITEFPSYHFTTSTITHREGHRAHLSRRLLYIFLLYPFYFSIVTT